MSQRSRPAKATNIDDHDLEKLAVEALLEDTRRRKLTVEKVGTMGWVKQRQVNKRFLNSVVLQTVSRHATKRVRVHEERTRNDKETSSEGRRLIGDYRSRCQDRDSRLSESDGHLGRRARDRDSSCDRETKKQRLTEERRQNKSERDRRMSHQRSPCSDGRHRMPSQSSVCRDRGSRVPPSSGSDCARIRHSRQPRTHRSDHK